MPIYVCRWPTQKYIKLGWADMVEQRFAELRLQRFDALADRRLADVEFLAGAREAHMPGGNFEDAEGVEGRRADRHDVLSGRILDKKILSKI